MFLKSTGEKHKKSTSTSEVFNIISLEPISERLTSRSFQEPSEKSVRRDVIGTFDGQLQENCIA